MKQSRLVPGKWIKSSLSSDPRDECVRVLLGIDHIKVGDTRNDAAVLRTSHATWSSLVAALAR